MEAAAEVCRDALGLDYFCFLSGIDWMPSAPNPEESVSTDISADADDAEDEDAAAEAEAEQEVPVVDEPSRRAMHPRGARRRRATEW